DQLPRATRAVVEGVRTVQEPAARRPLGPVLVQQHGPLDRSGTDDGRPHPEWRGAERDRGRTARVLDLADVAGAPRPPERTRGREPDGDRARQLGVDRLTGLATGMEAGVTAPLRRFSRDAR